jgi:hypothetical protein
MVDGGAPKKAKEFTKAIEKIGINTHDIKLIFLPMGIGIISGLSRRSKS